MFLTYIFYYYYCFICRNVLSDSFNSCRNKLSTASILL